MNVNDVARIRMLFVVDGALVDPTTITMTVTPPSSSGLLPYDVTYPDANLVRDSLGKYSGLVPIMGNSGRWRAEIVATGDAAGANFTTFYAYD